MIPRNCEPFIGATILGNLIEDSLASGESLLSLSHPFIECSGLSISFVVTLLKSPFKLFNSIQEFLIPAIIRLFSPSIPLLFKLLPFLL